MALDDDLRIPVGDAAVAATRYRPTEAEGPLPAVLMYTPYHKDDMITFGGYDPLLRYVAAHGYAVVAADMVGTGASSGEMDELFCQQEADDAVAIVEWLADREWSTGRVGMLGKSYGGITALWAAAERPDPLDAIVPILTPYTGFRNGYFDDGLFEFIGIGGDWLPRMQVFDAKPPGRRDADGRWATVWRERLQAIADRDPWLIQFRRHPTKDQFWADKDIAIDRIRTPTLAVGGWRDGYSVETVEFFEAIDAPKRLVFGPWRHVMPHRGREAAIDFRRQTVEWFDRFLKDADNDATDYPTITYWTERDGGGEPGAGEWRGRETWPTSGAGSDSIALAVASAGGESAGAAGRLVPADEFDGDAVTAEYDVDQTVGMASLEGLLSPTDGAPLDTHADDVRSLCFETEPLSSPVELTGTGEVTLRLAASEPDPLVAVRVVDVSPGGVSRLVTRGFCRPGLEESSATDDPFEAGTEQPVSIALEPRSHVFEAGHRLRLAVSGAYFPLVMPASCGGTFTVRSSPEAPSTVALPGRRLASGAFDDRVAMAAPDDSIAPSGRFFTADDGSWEVTRDRLGGTGIVRTSTEYAFEPPASPSAGTNADAVTYVQDIEARVDATDPTTAVVYSDTRLEMEYPMEQVVVTGSTRLDRDTVQMTTTVAIDDRVAFEETWSL